MDRSSKEIPCFSGYLDLFSNSRFKPHATKLWCTVQDNQLFCNNLNKGKEYIKIDLLSASSVSKLSGQGTFTFEVVTKQKRYVFGCSNEGTCDVWISEIQKVVSTEKMSSVTVGPIKVADEVEQGPTASTTPPARPVKQQQTMSKPKPLPRNPSTSIPSENQELTGPRGPEIPTKTKTPNVEKISSKSMQQSATIQPASQDSMTHPMATNSPTDSSTSKPDDSSFASSNQPATNGTNPQMPLTNDNNPQPPTPNSTKPQMPLTNDNNPQPPATNETKPQLQLTNNDNPQPPVTNVTNHQPLVTNDTNPQSSQMNGTNAQPPVENSASSHLPLTQPSTPKQNYAQPPVANDAMPKTPVPNCSKPQPAISKKPTVSPGTAQSQAKLMKPPTRPKPGSTSTETPADVYVIPLKTEPLTTPSTHGPNLATESTKRPNFLVKQPTSYDREDADYYECVDADIDKNVKTNDEPTMKSPTPAPVKPKGRPSPIHSPKEKIVKQSQPPSPPKKPQRVMDKLLQASHSIIDTIFDGGSHHVPVVNSTTEETRSTKESIDSEACNKVPDEGDYYECVDEDTEKKLAKTNAIDEYESIYTTEQPAIKNGHDVKSNKEIQFPVGKKRPPLPPPRQDSENVKTTIHPSRSNRNDYEEVESPSNESQNYNTLERRDPGSIGQRSMITSSPQHPPLQQSDSCDSIVYSLPVDNQTEVYKKTKQLRSQTNDMDRSASTSSDVYSVPIDDVTLVMVSSSADSGSSEINSSSNSEPVTLRHPHARSEIYDDNVFETAADNYEVDKGATRWDLTPFVSHIEERFSCVEELISLTEEQLNSPELAEIFEFPTQATSFSREEDHGLHPSIDNETQDLQLSSSSSVPVQHYVKKKHTKTHSPLLGGNLETDQNEIHPDKGVELEDMYAMPVKSRNESITALEEFLTELEK